MQNEGREPPILRSAFIVARNLRVTDGTRTRDVQDHNLALCQLSYGHQHVPAPSHAAGRVQIAKFIVTGPRHVNRSAEPALTPRRNESTFHVIPLSYTH